MRHASVLFHHQKRDEMFSPGPGANGGGLFFPFRRLREVFETVGVRLSTPDMNAGREVSFELHINARRRLPAVPCYAYLWEHPLIRPINGERRALARYRQVFTWNTALVDGRLVHELPIPNDLRLAPVPGFAERDLFCVVIAGNRALRTPHADSLQDRRLEVMRWFERHAPQDFALYGSGWDRPTKRPGIAGRLLSRVHGWKALWRPGGEFPATCRGPVASKDSVLRRSRFSICFENLRGGPGYITEKVFDCWLYGCLPVYIGASDFARRVPPACYIDGDAFGDPAALHAALHAITPEEFAWRRSCIEAFLASEAARPYDDEHFCQTLKQHVAADLGLA